MKKVKTKVNNYILILSIIVMVTMLTISVGYSALSTSLTINGHAAFKPIGMIRIMSITDDTFNNASSTSSSYTKDTISVTFDLNDTSSTASYIFNIRNLGETDKTITKILNESYSNSDITYTVEGISLGDKISPKDSINAKITFSFKDSVTNIYSNRLVARLKIVFDDFADNPVQTAYFKEYNGSLDLMGFTKTNIKTFQRNTALPLDAVLAKNGVTIVSTGEYDEYPSETPVYAWVESNNFYWWSEADIVYFHPKTRRAFNNYGSLTLVDLNGTSTSEVENLSHFFDTSRKLQEIKGIIDTSGIVANYDNGFDYASDNNNDSSGEEGLSYMFNDCNALKSVDLSAFDTSNATDMKRMFGGCKALKSIDVSHFDTSKVRSMYWMFRNCSSLTSLDLTNFDTGNVVNMNGMFLSSTSLQTITFGDNFNTNKVVNSTRMFENLTALQTIYSSKDFDINPNLNSNGMFSGNTLLVGGRGEEYETTFSNSHKDASYAKIASEEQSGYFTMKKHVESYIISYNLDGGTATNPYSYTNETETFTLNNPTKEGYTFIGWTGSNGDVLETTVTITQGSTGNLSFTAHYEIIDNTITISIAGPCTFNGKNGTITGENCTEYAGQKIINTNLSLYNEENYQRDYEISFTIDEFDENGQDSGVSQFTFMNTKYENSSKGYPGLVFRKDTSAGKYEITQTIEGVKVSKKISITSPMTVKVERVSGVIYYTINNGERLFLQDMNNFNKFFTTPVTFGSSLDQNGNPSRIIKGTLSNMKVVLK